MEENTARINFSEILASLADTEHPFPPRLLRGFSDLTPRNLRELAEVWPDLPALRKQGILEDLEEITEHDTLVCFDDLARAVITDPDPMVRVLALRLLWECEDSKLVPVITEIMRDDPDEAARATAASLLGRFVYLGELDQVPDAIKIPLIKNLLEVVSGEDLPQVRLRALEALGYSGHARVPDLIRTAYASNNTLWVASALCAMGRSADDQWADLVLDKIDSGDAEIRYEAIRAAGELELTSALDQLFSVLEDEDHDSEIRLAAIWSLSQVGGTEVKEKLEGLLEEAETDEETEWIEKALENLDLNGNAENLDFFDFKPPQDSDLDKAEPDDDWDEDLDEDDLYESLDDLDEDDEDE